MKAALLEEFGATVLEVAEVPDPRPRPGEALVAVAACGICGTDLHVMSGLSYRPALPFCLGHELVGRVAAVGDPHDEYLVGHRVVPTLFSGCGSCAACRAGEERLCERGADVLGVLGRQGGFAERVLVEVRNLVLVPDGLSDEDAATLVDAGTTAHNAVRRLLEHAGGRGGRHLVLGGGPAGLFVAELLQLHGEEATTVEVSESRRKVLEARGFAVTSRLEDLPAGWSSVIDCAGDPALVDRALSLLRPRGRYMVVGYSRVPGLDLAAVSRRELCIVGVRSGARGDLEQVLSAVARGAVKPPPVDTYALSEINDALVALRAGTVRGKAVVVPAATTRTDSLSTERQQ